MKIKLFLLSLIFGLNSGLLAIRQKENIKPKEEIKPWATCNPTKHSRPVEIIEDVKGKKISRTLRCTKFADKHFWI
jgi:hypothetical protein